MYDLYQRSFVSQKISKDFKIMMPSLERETKNHLVTRFSLKLSAKLWKYWQQIHYALCSILHPFKTKMKLDFELEAPQKTTIKCHRNETFHLWELICKSMSVGLWQVYMFVDGTCRSMASPHVIYEKSACMHVYDNVYCLLVPCNIHLPA